MARGIYTYPQYIALGMNAPWTGPFELENRPPRDQGGAGNYYASRGEYENDLLGIVIHITAGITDLIAPDHSAESTNNYGRTTNVAASWTGLVDSDSIINSLHPRRVAWVQGVPGYNFNRPLVGVEVGKREPEWRGMPQAWVDSTLRNLAAYCAPIVIKHKIPLRVETDRNRIQQLINAKQKVGFTEHWYLTPSTRSDAGRVNNVTTFPWTRFFGFLRTRMAELQNKTPMPTPGPTPVSVKDGTILQVTATRLNTRSGPGTNYDVVGGADKGVKIRATGKVSGAWIEAQTDWQRSRRIKTWWHTGHLKVVSQPKPAPTPAPAPPTTTLKTYTVKSGDSLSVIAAKYMTSVKALQYLNGIDNPNRIEVGQVLYLGWVVSRGDTLGVIATRYGTTVAKLMSLNGIKDPNKIEVGQLIRLP